MRGIAANYKNELQKLFGYKKYIVFLIIQMLICVIAVCSKLLAVVISEGSWNLNNLSSAVSLMTLFVDVIIPFISMMGVCDLFASEFGDKTIRAVFLRPSFRYKVYAGKFLAVLTLTVINLLTVLISASVLDLIISGRIVSPLYSLSAYLIDIVPLAILISMAVLINQLVKNSTLSMFLCIILYVVLKLAGTYIPTLGGLLFTGYMQWHKLWLGSGVPLSALLGKLWLMLGYGITFNAAGYYLFRYKEC
ncbi:MAG TPA: ABC transporter permease subunit [Candidatus Monoglobus merdigallinarum]|uniref:ABC transporter permease subunit n=1 Tax=Candidatus Monoglobus merdigallinarum TaxID=2838698 RepID=A0A9D1PS77_9FIRM|nr:ABC transporter permease subunit [Candidatus Monoglobus merdigallinarum]